VIRMYGLTGINKKIFIKTHVYIVVMRELFKV